MVKIIVILFFFTISCFANNKKNILILHSYHQSFKWTDDISKGIKKSFKDNSHEIKFHIEYMDTKRYVDKKYYELLYNLYKKKYLNTQFDVIISSDNNAFNFLKLYNKKLFNSAPVIFSGINYLKKEDTKDFPNFKGINEKANIRKNYALIKKLHPNVKNIYTIIDDTTTGKKIKEEVLEIIQNSKKDKIKYKIINGSTYQNFLKEIKMIPPNSVILLSVYFRTKDNLFFEYYEISKLLEKLDVAPVYGLWDFNLENGIIGGYLTSGLFQGKEAGKMAIKILNGIAIEDIHTQYQSPNKYMFDYKKFKKYNINENNLPKNSYIINKTESFYDLYKKEIITLIILFICMLILIVLLSINIKRRIKAEKNTKKQLSFQKTLLNTIETPIYYKDLESNYIGCNKAFEVVNNVKKDDIIGKNVYTIFPVETAEIYDEKDKELLRNGGSQQYESIQVSKNGEKKFLMFYKKVFFDENDEMAGLVGAIFDITQLKQTTKELNDLNVNLEKKVKQRTQELEFTINDLKSAQDKLVEAEKMASLGGLVAGIAHEINTPLGISLTGITHFKSVEKELHELYNNNKMSQENFEDFLNQTDELSTLIINNLTKTSLLVKSFKQISVDQTSEEKRDFELIKYLNNIILSINNIIKKTKHTIEIQIDSEIICDSYPGAFSQIFTNLIINSFNHGFKNIEKGTIIINAYEKDDNIIISYSDNGVGIKEEVLPKIFDPFFTTNREHGGTGLGLNIIYNIITRLLKGTIKCKSEENKGVEFIITVPKNI